MQEQDYKNLSDEELLLAHKKNKSSAITIAVLIGVLIGVALYSAVNNGFKFFTFFPLILIYFFFGKNKKNKALEEEIKARNLEIK